jgi:hypothetical protein
MAESQSTTEAGEGACAVAALFPVAIALIGAMREDGDRSRVDELRRDAAGEALTSLQMLASTLARRSAEGASFLAMLVNDLADQALTGKRERDRELAAHALERISSALLHWLSSQAQPLPQAIVDYWGGASVAHPFLRVA